MAKGHEETNTQANIYIKTFSVSLPIQEIQIKTIISYHYIPITMGKMKDSDNTKCWGGCGEMITYVSGGIVKWYSHHEEQLGGFLKN